MPRSLEKSPEVSEIRSKGAAPGKRYPRVEAVGGAFHSTFITRPDDPAKAERAKQLEGDLKLFVEAAWPQVDPQPYRSNWHVGAVCEVLTALHLRQVYSVLINIPPGFAKSLICSVLFPSWEWTTEPERRYLSSSHSAKIPERDGRKMRDLIRTEWYASMWPSVRINPELQGMNRFENVQKGYRVSTSVDSGTTGERGDTIIFDDPHDILDARHPGTLAASINHYAQVLINRGIGEETRKLVVAQRIASRDCSRFIMETEAMGGESYEYLILPMRHDPAFQIVIGDYYIRDGPDPRDERAEGSGAEAEGTDVLFEDMYPAPVAQALEQGAELAQPGSSHAIYGQNPSESLGTTFRPSDLRNFWVERDGPTEHWLLEAPDGPKLVEPWQVWKVLTVDLAASTKTTADFFVIQAWGLTAETDLLLLEAFSSRLEGPEQMPQLWGMVREHRPYIVLIESNAYQLAYVQEAIRQGLPVLPVHAEKNLEIRSIPLQSRMRLGKVFLRGQAPWMEEVRGQFLAFPDAKIKDDHISAAAQLVREIAVGNLMIPEGTPVDIPGETYPPGTSGSGARPLGPFQGAPDLRPGQRSPGGPNPTDDDEGSKRLTLPSRPFGAEPTDEGFSRFPGEFPGEFPGGAARPF